MAGRGRPGQIGSRPADTGLIQAFHLLHLILGQGTLLHRFRFRGVFPREQVPAAAFVAAWPSARWSGLGLVGRNQPTASRWVG